MRFLSFALIIVFALPVMVCAQSAGGIGDTSSFSVTVSPQFPAPNGSATLSFLSSTFNLANATLAVTVAGKKIYQGSVQPVPIAVGKTGSVTNVSVTLTASGANYSQTVSLQPQDVSLVAEPVSSAPPLYAGKPHIPTEGSVRVIAVANLKSVSGRALDPSTLSYAWKVDNTEIANSSGIGKTALMVASPLQYRRRDVSVIVTSSDGSLIGGDSLSLSPEDPLVRIYANDPLLGIVFSQALSGQFAVGDTETSLYAAPFSFSTTLGAPFIQWFLNGDAAQTGRTITLRPTGAGQGNASLSLTASLGDNVKATASLPLIFGSTPDTNFFGL